MAQQFVNGEWVDDEQNSDSGMAGLTSTATPKNTQAAVTDTSGPSEFQSFVGKYDAPQGRDWYSHEISGIAQQYADSMGKGGDPNYVGSIVGNAYPGKTFQQAPANLFPEGQVKSSDWADTWLPALAIGGLGLATGGFGFGLGGLGGAAAGETALGSAIASEFAAVGAAPWYTGAAASAAGPSWLGDAFANAASGGGTIASEFAGALDGFSGINAGITNDAFSGFYDNPVSSGNPAASAQNLEQALSTPQNFGGSQPADVVGTGDGYGAGNEAFNPGYDQVGPIDPQAPQGLDSALKTGLDTQGANMRMGGTGLNNLYGSPGSAGSINGINPGASSYLGSTPVNVSQAAMNPSSFGIKDIFKAFQSPEGTIARKAFDVYNQNQKVNTIKDLMSQFRQQGDPGAPFRDRLNASYSNPDFFKSMPEYQAGMDTFNQQYGATAAKNGMRSQLGGAAHNIAVNRASAGLADQYRSRLAQMAGQQPNMSGQIGLANSLASAQGNQFNTLFDPSLWAAISKLSA